MSMYIDFEPHSYYKGFAIRYEDMVTFSDRMERRWLGITDNGNTYRIDELSAATLAQLKEVITKYRSK